MVEKKRLTFVTGNEEKIADIKEMLAEKTDLTIISELELLEIQSLSVEEVVANKSKQAHKILKVPVAVSDSGLEIEALNAFPGALVKFVNETIGQEGLVKLLVENQNRKAYFKAAIGYCDSKHGTKVFMEKDEGTIAFEPRGKGWHFDQIFIPKGNNRTWAEMGRERKNENSAFRRALEKMVSFLLKNDE